MKYKLLAADMDGTLLNDNRELTPRTVAALRKMVEAGIWFVPSTGRPLSRMGMISSLFDEDMPFILYNGAMVAMHLSGEVLHSVSLSPDTAKEVYQLGQERDLSIALWQNEKLYFNRDCPFTRQYGELHGSNPNLISEKSDLESLAQQGITKILWIDHPSRIINFFKEMAAHFGDSLNCHPSRPEFLEFVHAAASKAAAMEVIGARLGVSQAEMVAIGDGYNDLSMLQYAGFSVAMGNAPGEIKAVCNHVTCSNNEDGVAVFIEKHLL